MSAAGAGEGGLQAPGTVETVNQMRDFKEPPNPSGHPHPEQQNFFWQYYHGQSEACPCKHNGCLRVLCLGACVHAEIQAWASESNFARALLECLLCPLCWPCMIGKDRDAIERKIHRFHSERGDPRASAIVEINHAGPVIAIGLSLGAPAQWLMHAQNYEVMQSFRETQSQFL